MAVHRNSLKSSLFVLLLLFRSYKPHDRMCMADCRPVRFSLLEELLLTPLLLYTIFVVGWRLRQGKNLPSVLTECVGVRAQFKWCNYRVSCALATPLFYFFFFFLLLLFKFFRYSTVELQRANT